MNLNAIAAPYTRTVNPPLVGQAKISTGATKNAQFQMIATYAAPVDATFDVQALTAEQLAHLDSLNITGVRRSIYFNGRLDGIDRPAGKGGDLLLIPTGLTGAELDTWLVVQLLEQWDTGGWVKVAGQLQVNP